MFSTATQRQPPSDSIRSFSLLELGAYRLEGDLTSSAHVPRDSALLLSDHMSGRSIDQEASYSDHSGTRGALSGSGSYSSSTSPPESFDASPPQYHASHLDHQHLPREEHHIQYPPSHPNTEPRVALPQLSTDTSTPVPNMSSPPKPPSVTEVTPAEASGDSVPSQSPPKTHPANHRPRKARREKPHIQLASDQPPTTQGKPRARVYVACIQWYVYNCFKRDLAYRSLTAITHSISIP